MTASYPQSVIAQKPYQGACNLACPNEVYEYSCTLNGGEYVPGGWCSCSRCIMPEKERFQGTRVSEFGYGEPVILGQPKSLALQNLRVIEGSVFDMGDVINGDQGVIAFAKTGKNQVNFGKTTNQAGGTVIFMGGI